MTELPTTNETQFCEVGHQTFRDLINSQFAVPGDLVATARNIYHYVRDNISYEDYSNTRKGAYATLQQNKGNCCDQAHLLVLYCVLLEYQLIMLMERIIGGQFLVLINNIIVILLIKNTNLEVQIIIMVGIIIYLLFIIL